MNVPKKKFPELVTTKNLIEGECLEYPEKIEQFLRNVIGGRDKEHSAKTKSIANFLMQDFVYHANRGRVLTQKHLHSAIFFKSKTNCRRIIDVLNRLGVSISYNYVEELKTSLASTIFTQTRICPPEFVLEPRRLTCVAFDNYDRFVDSTTNAGKETLHDTVGIISRLKFVGDQSYIQSEVDATGINNDSSFPHQQVDSESDVEMELLEEADTSDAVGLDFQEKSSEKVAKKKSQIQTKVHVHSAKGVRYCQ